MENEKRLDGKKLLRTDTTRPLDALGKMTGRNVTVETWNDMTITGVLRSFDIHINVVLENAGKTKGQLFIRGANVRVIHEAN